MTGRRNYPHWFKVTIGPHRNEQFIGAKLFQPTLSFSIMLWAYVGRALGL